MPVDPGLFKQVMARWSSGITVITSAAEGQWQGITANSFASVSLNPPLVSVSIDKKLYIHSVIDTSRIFAANILSVDQVEWGKLFAGFYPEVEDRFSGMACQTAVTGSPILPDVIGWVDCQVRHAYDAGDHTIFVGEVVAGDTPVAVPPLAYHNRAWGEFVQQPPESAQLIEVGPSARHALPVEAKFDEVESLVEAGFTHVQVAVFAASMPAQIFDSLQKHDGVIYSALVLDMPGLEQARAAGFSHVDFAVSAGDSSIPLSQAMEQFVLMVSYAHEHDMRVRASIGHAFDGDFDTITKMAQNFLDVGVHEITIADSMGAATPLQLRKLVTALRATTGATPISLRLYNARGLGLANMLAALETGVNRFETAYRGLGEDADSHIPTEDAVYMFQSMGIQTSINLPRLSEIAGRAAPLPGKPPVSRAEKLPE
jgi:flavin reductase (DIM6/NTAB) family NADH-FMN oxidoreductase RutF